MQTGTCTGYSPRTTVDAPKPDNNDGSGLCDACGRSEADGYDAERDAHVCRDCAKRGEPVTDGGTDVSDPVAWADSLVYHDSAIVSTVDGRELAVDHVERKERYLRLVNYDDGEVAEVVDFPHRRIEGIQWLPLRDGDDE